MAYLFTFGWDNIIMQDLWNALFLFCDDFLFILLFKAVREESV